MNDQHVVKVSQVERNELYQFYKKAFGNRNELLESNWKWWYRFNYLNCEPLVLISEKRIIGHLGLIPAKIKFDNKIFNATWYVDFAVLSEAQGKGAGSKLVKEGMKISKIQMAFCNDEALRVYQKFEWKISDSIKRLARPINPIKWIPILKNFNLEIFKKFYNFSLGGKKLIKPYSINNNSKILFETFGKRKEKPSTYPEIYRDDDWLNWRLLECPFNKNIQFFEYNGNFAVTHLIKSKNIKRLHIIYFYCLEESYENQLYYFIAQWAFQNGIDLLWVCSGDQNLISDVEKIFPKRFIKPTILASFSSEKIFMKN